MKNYFIKTLGLSPKGASDLQKASFWVAIVNFILMGTSGMIFYFLEESLAPVLEGKSPQFQVLTYVIFTVVLLFFLFFEYYFAYNGSYLAAYSESATKRITLAECLRKLPVSFFGKKDVSDITTTIMADVAELETSFSHYIPSLFGSLAPP